MKKETLHKWAADMLQIIHEVDANVIGGMGGMGSSDGHYVSASKARKIATKFVSGNRGYKVWQWDNDINTVLVTPLEDESYGFIISTDSDFPKERILNWFEADADTLDAYNTRNTK